MQRLWQRVSGCRLLSLSLALSFSLLTAATAAAATALASSRFSCRSLASESRAAYEGLQSRSIVRRSSLISALPSSSA